MTISEFSFLLRSPQSSPVADDPALYCFEEMETIRRVVLPSSYCLHLHQHKYMLPSFLFTWVKTISPARPISLLVKKHVLSYIREICSSNSQPFSVTHQFPISRIILTAPRMLLLFHHKSPLLTPFPVPLFPMSLCLLFRPTCSWMYCLCSTCSFNCAYLECCIIFSCLLFLFLNWPE